MSLWAASNTEVPCYLVLIDKGYEVLYEQPKHWTAKKGDLAFSATGLIDLPGLVAMYEERGDDWRASDQSIDEFFRKYSLG